MVLGANFSAPRWTGTRFDRLSILADVDIIKPDQRAKILNSSQRQHDNASDSANNKHRFQDSYRNNQHVNSRLCPGERWPGKA